MTKPKSTDQESRRKFLTLGFLSGAALITQKAGAMGNIEEGDEKVPMLTADGKLVEVSKRIIDQAPDRKKVQYKEILSWSNAQNKSKP